MTQTRIVHLWFANGLHSVTYILTFPEQSRGAINHGAVAVHQNRPAIFVLLVCLHTDPKQENHTPIRSKQDWPISCLVAHESLKNEHN